MATIGLRLTGMPPRVYLPSLVFPDIGNLGLPVCLFAFGQRGLALAIVFFAVTTVGASAKKFDWRTASRDDIGCEIGDIADS